MTSPGQADPARQPLGRTVCWLENPRPAPFPLQQSSTRPGHLKSPCQPEQFVEFCLEMAPWSNQCPETSTEQKTIKKTVWLLPRPTACQKDGRWKSGRRWISQMNLLLNYITVSSNIAGDLLEKFPPHGSEIHPENSKVWWRKNHGLKRGYIQYQAGCVRDLQGGINSLKYQEVLAFSYIPNHKRGHIVKAPLMLKGTYRFWSNTCCHPSNVFFHGRPCLFQQDNAKPHSAHLTTVWLRSKRVRVLDWPCLCSRMVLHRILPSLHQSSSRRRRSRCSRIGQPSHQT